MIKNKYDNGIWGLIVFLIILTFIAAFAPGIARADEDKEGREPGKLEEKLPSLTWKLSGYAKSLWVSQREKENNDEWTVNVNRLRLNNFIKYRNNLSLRVIYDLEAYTGNMVSTPYWDYLANEQEGSYWNLSTGSRTGKAAWINHSIYRAFLYWDAKFAQFTVGKQRVSWGAMRFWRPTDMFNAEDPLQIEAGERLGLDGVDVFMPVGAADLEYVWSPSRHPDEYISAGKFHFTAGEYDYTVVGGRVRKNDVMGFTFNGYIGDGGFRGEALRVKPWDKDEYWLWTVGGDYSFPDTTTITLEYMNNGGATGWTIPLYAVRRDEGLILTKERQFLALGISRDITPLIKFNLFSAYDIEGKSTAVAPKITWNPQKNWEVNLGMQFYGGKYSGEYGSYPDAYFSELKLYF